MNQEWNDLILVCSVIEFGFSLVQEMILGSDSSHNNWVDALKMRWVSEDFDC